MAASSSTGAPAAFNVPLTKQECVSKLDSCPTFNIVTVLGNKIIGTTDDSGEEAVRFWVDPDEASSALVVAQLQKPDVPLRLACTSLGTAFALVVGWANTGSALPLRLHPSKAVLAAVAEELGAAPDNEAFPIFACDALMNQKVIPLFLTKQDLKDTWIASGRPAESLPTDITVTSLRKIVSLMLADASMNWRGAMLVANMKAVEKAQQVQEAEAAAKEADPLEEPPPLQ